jgi:hypothetical protein
MFWSLTVIARPPVRPLARADVQGLGRGRAHEQTATHCGLDERRSALVSSFVPLSCVRALTCRRARGTGWDDRRDDHL